MTLKLVKSTFEYAEQVMKFKDDMVEGQEKFAGTAGLSTANTFEEMKKQKSRVRTLLF